MGKKISNEEFKNVIFKKFNGNILVINDFISYRESRNMQFKCVTHNYEFNMNAQNILRCKNKACPVCSGIKYTKEIIDKILKQKNNKLSVVEWKDNYTVDDTVTFNCTEHGNFDQKLRLVFQYENGCKQCGNKNKLVEIRKETISNINKILLNSAIKLEDTSFINVNTPANFICNKHGSFKRRPAKILYEGYINCPSCNQSLGEKHTENILNKLNINFKSQFKLDSLFLDFFLTEYNFAIEFDGKQHHDTKSKFFSNEQVLRDERKNLICLENGIKLFRIQDNSKGFTNKKLEKLESLILEVQRLGITNISEKYSQVVTLTLS